MNNELQTLEKPLPHNAEVERNMLGVMLLNSERLDESVKLGLTAAAFYLPSNRRIYAALLALRESGTEINLLTIGEQLERDDTLAAVGGYAWLSRLTHGVPHLASIKHPVETVVEYARLRSLARLSGQLQERALDGDDTSTRIAEDFDARLAEFREGAGHTAVPERGRAAIIDLLDAQLDRFERFHRNETDAAIPTGFNELDEKLTGRGLMKSHLHILAARPSIGKTSLALDIAANAAAAGRVVLFVTLEMSKEILLDRLFAVASGVERWKIQPGLYSGTLTSLRNAASDLARLPLHVDDAARSPAAISRTVRDMRRDGLTPDLIVVDYLQLMDTQPRGTRNDEVGANSRAMQSLAKETDAAVVLLSQLSRKCDMEKREPELHDLRDSGEIEQDARTVFFLFGDKPEETEREDGTLRDITIKCAKQGEGPLFRAALPFDSQLVTFRSFGHIIAATKGTDDSQDARFM
jgi:replicative DNA helicase